MMPETALAVALRGQWRKQGALPGALATAAQPEGWSRQTDRPAGTPHRCG